MIKTSDNKIILRDLEEHDHELYYSWINDTETNNLRGLYNPISKIKASEKLTKLFIESENSLSLVIEFNGTSVGLIGYRQYCPRSRRAEMWIYIGEKTAWGKGIGTFIASEITYRAKELGLEYLYGEPEVENFRSINLLFKDGYKITNYENGVYIVKKTLEF